MRLINVNTLELEEFYSDMPEYAILSHCWGKEEISFKDWQDARRSVEKKEGYTKIHRACEETMTLGYGYLWCDTNCIDKSSSAELSEAINSMFNWYGRSSICLAYLDDVLRPPEVTFPLHFGNQFCASRWFTRGWTLQELLAPPGIKFYDKDWQFIGWRSTLADLVTRATGIGRIYMQPAKLDEDGDLFAATRRALDAASVARRMAWLSKRKTTRVEDMAYCMLGIFDINMPLLYGEGTKAFQRLQEEIIRTTNDMTIFCWHWDDKHVSPGWDSMLAPSPGVFEKSGGYLEWVATGDRDRPTTTYSVTNAGLFIVLQVVCAGPFVLALLNVAHSDYAIELTRFAICLVHMRHLGADIYVRTRLPPLAVAGQCDLLPVLLQDVKTHRRPMHIPLRQVHLRPRGGLTTMPLDEEVPLRPLDLRFRCVVLVVLQSSVDAVVDASVAPKNMLPLEYDRSHRCWMGVLPIQMKDHNLTIWFGFGLSHTGPSQMPGRVRGVRLGSSLCNAPSRDRCLYLYRQKLAQYLATGISETGGITGMSPDECPLGAWCAVAHCVRFNARTDLAVATVAVHHIVDMPCKLCPPDLGNGIQGASQQPATETARPLAASGPP